MENKPLTGIRVIDLTQIYQGPYAAFLMAAAGAEVVKVEPPGGERLRGRGGAHTPLSFVMLNSNKKSVTLNLKHDDGKQLLRDMVPHADVLLENFAPGTLDRLGLGWEKLRQLNPRLVYGSGSGYGLSGPDHDQLAMDHTIQAASGIMSATGDADQPPSRAGGAPCDIMGGIHMYAGVTTALLGRATSGRGTLVEVSMQESMYFTLCSELAAMHASGQPPPRQSGRSPSGACPYGRYRCTDGWIAIISVAEAHWQAIARTIGRTDLLENEAFDAAHKRKKQEAAINAMIEEWSAQLSRDEAFARMREAKVPVAAVKTLDEVVADPHMLSRGMLNPMHHPVMGDMVLPNSPIRYSEYDANTLEFCHEPGADNADVYRSWLGLDASTVAGLAERNVI